MLTRLRWLAILLILCFLFPLGALAQSAGGAALLPPNTDQFPLITTYLDIHDEQGQFVTGLQAGDVRILEDNLPLPALQLVQEQPGVQFVVAIANGRSLSIRDTLGNSRYFYLSTALLAWAKDHAGNGKDDLSLILDGGPQGVHLTQAQDFRTTLENYTPEAANTPPTLEVFSRALDVAADPTPRPAMERAVLFITPLQDAEVAAGIQSLIARANQSGIRVFVWLVSAPEMFGSSEAALLQSLATQTGGQFFAFSSAEAIPDLEEYLQPLRSIYSLTYESKIRSGSAHQLAAEITRGDQTITTPPQTFDLIVQPPNPILMALPAEITRSPITSPDADQPADGEETLAPTSQAVEVLVEFPDGHTRSIVRTALYVDGILIGENVDAPYEQFTWELTPYEDSGEHLLRVEAEDSLGLLGTSAEIPVEIIVKRPTLGLLGLLSQRGLLIGIGGVMLAGAVLILVLVLGGRIRPASPAVSQGKGRGSRWLGQTSRRKGDPVTQPVEIKAEPAARRSLWTSRLHLATRRAVPRPAALLTPFSDFDEQPPESPVPLGFDEIIFGQDAARATLVLTAPSVASVHAYLRREGERFRLSDAGSQAGTWINYLPIAAEGALLQHGDLIHIGQAGFRFTYTDPARMPRPVISVQNNS